MTSINNISLANRSMEFISFPIKDGDINQDDQYVLNFCLDLCDRLRRGQKILVHCWLEVFKLKPFLMQ